MMITGSSKDGSDARIAMGMFVSPCGTYWSSAPITHEQKAYVKIYDHCERYNKSFHTLSEQLKSGSKENLPRWARIWFIGWYTPEKEVVVSLDELIDEFTSQLRG